jgi:undecaprenyl diphosphate synthase
VTRKADALSRTARRESGGAVLRHVMVVGGTLGEWAEMSPDDWHKRVDELGSYCASIGVPWLTVRVYDATGDQSDWRSAAWHHEVDGCSVAVDPCASGRERFASAMSRLDPGVAISESTVAGALYAPADCEPDLLVILGPSTQLPPSLVWELAYAELVFLPVGWSGFAAADLAGAVVDFTGRRRRFGGLDDE